MFIGFILFNLVPVSLASNVFEASKESTWLKLIHYKNNNGLFLSDISSSEFFLSHNGAVSPSSELKATISSFKQAFNTRYADDHPICKFPARYIWLTRKELIKNRIDPFIDCPSFISWIKPSGLDSISLVLVTGYLGNPASTSWSCSFKNK